MRVTIALLALVSSALAYEIDSPNASQGWVGTTKQQTVTWRKGSDDPSVITVKLVNTAKALNIVLASGVEGNPGGHPFDPINGGWPAGSDNYIYIVGNDGAVLAQSPPFTIGDAKNAA